MTKAKRGSVQPQRLARRTFLRGAVGGAAVAIGLPTLDCMLNGNATALAQGGALPKRFGTYYWGGGIVHGAWVPSATGMDWTPPDSLAAFTDRSAALKPYLTVVTGVNHRYVGPGHIPARGISLSSSHNTTYVTGTAADGYRMQQHPEPSLDMVVLGALQAAGVRTPRPSVHVATTKASPYYGNSSWRAGGAVNDPVDDPAALFSTLFADGLPSEAGDPALLERTRRLEKSMLDAVMGDTARLQARLGQRDRARLEEHLEGLRELERRLTEGPPPGGECAVPGAPAAFTTMARKGELYAELLAVAFACDLTRVVSYEWSANQSEYVYAELGVAGSHHNDITHNLGARDADARKIMRLIMGNLAVFAERLRQMPEGAGNVLDNTLLFATSEHANAGAHNYQDHPFLLVGKAGGAIKAGQHYRHPDGGNAAAPQVMLTAVRAVAPTVEKLGQDDPDPKFQRYATTTLGALEA